jgi:K+-transporting ATPase ATPase C chain
MKKNLWISISMTVVTTILLGLFYPLVVTGLAQLVFPPKANGELIVKNGKVIGSSIIGQGFSGPGYFHSRLSAAGNGYDASNSGGSNFGPTNQKLLDRVKGDVAAARADNPNTPVPVDLITTSSSGLDPDITPAAALFQIPRISRIRRISQDQVRTLVQRHIQQREFGFLGEPRVNVLGLNLALDEKMDN